MKSGRAQPHENYMFPDTKPYLTSNNGEPTAHLATWEAGSLHPCASLSAICHVIAWAVFHGLSQFFHSWFLPLVPFHSLVSPQSLFMSLLTPLPGQLAWIAQDPAQTPVKHLWRRELCASCCSDLPRQETPLASRLLHLLGSLSGAPLTTSPGSIRIFTEPQVLFCWLQGQPEATDAQNKKYQWNLCENIHIDGIEWGIRCSKKAFLLLITALHTPVLLRGAHDSRSRARNWLQKAPRPPYSTLPQLWDQQQPVPDSSPALPDVPAAAHNPGARASAGGGVHLPAAKPSLPTAPPLTPRRGAPAGQRPWPCSWGWARLGTA